MDLKRMLTLMTVAWEGHVCERKIREYVKECNMGGEKDGSEKEAHILCRHGHRH